MLQGNTKNLPLQNIFQTLALNQQEGILSVSYQRLERHVAIRKTGVSVLCERPHSSRLLQIITTHLRILTPNEYENVFATTSAEAPPGDVLIDRHVLNPNLVGDTIREQVQEFLYEVFEWHDAVYRFDVREIPHDRFIFSHPEMAHRLEFPVNAVLMEVARREDEWQRVRKLIPTQHELYQFVANTPPPQDLPMAVNLSPERLQSLVELIDGSRTVEELIETSRVPPFFVFSTLRSLIEAGCLRPVPLLEKKALAEKLRQKFQMERVANVYRSILEEAPTESEVRKKLVLQLERKNASAGELTPHYRVLARQAHEAGDFNACQQYLEKILAISPKDVDAVELMVLVHLHNHKEKAAFTMLREYSSLVRKHRQFDRGAAFLLKTMEGREPEGWMLHEAAHLFLLAGNPQSAAVHYDKAAKLFARDNDLRRLAKVVEKLEMCDARAAARWRRHLEGARPATRHRSRRYAAFLAVGIVIVAAAFAAYEVDARISYADFLNRADQMAAFDLSKAHEELDRFAEAHPFTLTVRRVPSDKARLERIANQKAADKIKFPANDNPLDTAYSEQVVSQGTALRHKGELVEALALYQRADLAKLTPSARKVVQNEIRDITRLLGEAQALRDRAQKAIQAGNLREASECLTRVVRDYPYSPGARDLRLPLVLDVRPFNAEVIVDGKRLEGPQYVIWTTPGQEPVVSVSAPSFVPQVHEVDAMRGWAASIFLQKQPLWTRPVDSYVEATPCVVHGALIYGNRSGEVLCHDNQTGERRWSYKLEGLGDCLGAIVTADDDILFTGTDSALYRFNWRNGTLVWRLPMEAYTRLPLSPPDEENRTFIVTTNLKVVAVDVEHRKILWERTVGGIGDFPATAIDNKVIVATKAGRITALDAASGEQVWQREFDRCACTAPTAVDNRIVIGLDDGRVLALEAATGKTSWTYSLNHALAGRAQRLEAGRLVVLDQEGSLFCLRIENGERVWESAAQGQFQMGPKAVDGHVLTLNADGLMEVFRGTDGLKAWDYHAKSKPSANLAAANGVAFVAGSDRRVHAVLLKTD